MLTSRQKHANAMQATETQRQGKTLMVFTIVTVIFLPLSFLAAFFAINITGLPHDEHGHPNMSIGYVSKYIFGIGVAIAFTCVVLAWSAEKVDIMRMNAQRWTWRHLSASSATGLQQAKKAFVKPPVKRVDTNLSARTIEPYEVDTEKQIRRLSLLEPVKKLQQSMGVKTNSRRMSGARAAVTD